MSLPRFSKPLTAIAFALIAMLLSDATSGQAGQTVLPTKVSVECSARVVTDAGPYRLTTDLRIKRMYLVRPDLIGYPNFQDIYA